MTTTANGLNANLVHKWRCGCGAQVHYAAWPVLYAKVLSNPPLKEFEAYGRLGEQAAWRRLVMIRDRTRLSRLFGTRIGELMQRLAAHNDGNVGPGAAPQPVPGTSARPAARTRR